MTAVPPAASPRTPGPYAGSRPVVLPPEVERGLERLGPEYGRAFRESYSSRLRERRRRAALLGGAAGTVAGLALLLRAANGALE